MHLQSEVNCGTSVDGINDSLVVELIACQQIKVEMLLVVCQFSCDVIGCEDCKK